MPRLASPRSVLVFVLRCALIALITVPATLGGSVPIVVLHAAKKHQPGKVTFLDPDTLAVVGEAKVNGSPLPLRFDSSGGVLYVYGTPRPGPVAATSKKPWTLSRVDAGSFASRLVGEVGRWPITSITNGSQTRLYVLGGAPKAKLTPIGAFDLVAGKALGPIASVERLLTAALSPDGRLLYALCQGKKHKRPKGPPGNLHVLDAMTGAEMARRDVGRGASSVAFDPAHDLAYVLGAADADEGGLVTVLRGAEVAGRFSIPGRALALAFGPNGATFVLAKGAVVELAGTGLAVARTWRVDFDPGDLVFDAPRGRMFVGALAGSKIAELDSAREEVIVEHPTGRAGVKVGKGIGIAAVGLFAMGATVISGIPVVPVGLLASHPTSMALSADGAFLYVLNTFTNDITLFDPVKRDVVLYVPTGQGSRRIVRVADDPNLWIESRAHLVRLNTTTNQIDRTIETAGGLAFATVAYDQRRERAWILRDTKVHVLDLRTGEIVGTVDLSSPAFGLWIDNSAVAPPMPTQ